MVNFNLQDGFSVLTLPNASPSSSQSLIQDNDLSVDKMPPLLDSYNLIQNSQQMSSEMPTAASSVLLVHGVQFKHAGNYTCAPSNTRPTNINVHVLKGKVHASHHNFSPRVLLKG